MFLTSLNHISLKMVKTVNFILHAFYHIFIKWEKSTNGYNAKWYILLKNFLRYSYKSWFKMVNFLLCVFYHNFKNQGKNEMGWKILIYVASQQRTEPFASLELSVSLHSRTLSPLYTLMTCKVYLSAWLLLGAPGQLHPLTCWRCPPVGLTGSSELTGPKPQPSTPLLLLFLPPSLLSQQMTV